MQAANIVIQYMFFLSGIISILYDGSDYAMPIIIFFDRPLQSFLMLIFYGVIAWTNNYLSENGNYETLARKGCIYLLVYISVLVFYFYPPISIGISNTFKGSTFGVSPILIFVILMLVAEIYNRRSWFKSTRNILLELEANTWAKALTSIGFGICFILHIAIAILWFGYSFNTFSTTEEQLVIKNLATFLPIFALSFVVISCIALLDMALMENNDEFEYNAWISIYVILKLFDIQLIFTTIARFVISEAQGISNNNYTTIGQLVSSTNNLQIGIAIAITFIIACSSFCFKLLVIK
jgi:hypothetical protein